MKPTVCYGTCGHLSLQYPTSQAEMNQSPVSLRPFFQEFQVLLLRLSGGFRGAPIGRRHTQVCPLPCWKPWFKICGRADWRESLTVVYVYALVASWQNIAGSNFHPFE